MSVSSDTSTSKRVEPTLTVAKIERVAFDDVRVLLINEHYDLHLKVKNPEYQDCYELGQLELDPHGVAELAKQFDLLVIENDELKRLQGGNQVEAIKELQQAVENHVSTINSQGSVITSLRSELGIATGKITDLSSDLSSANAENNKLSMQISGLSTQMDDARSELATAKSKIAELEAQLTQGAADNAGTADTKKKK